MTQEKYEEDPTNAPTGDTAVEPTGDTTAGDTTTGDTTTGKTVEELQAELKAKEEELVKLQDKDHNFAKVREQKKEAEQKAQTLQEQIDAKVEEAKNEILESTQKDHYNTQIETLTEGDKELKKKVEYHYNRIKDTASTKEEVSKKLRDAYLLATAKEDEGVPASTFSSASAGNVKPKGQSTFTAEEKQLAQKLAKAGGLSLEDEDFNK